MKEIKLNIYFSFLIMFTVYGVCNTGQSCQDIDHAACIAMASHNTNMCSDPVLRSSACPKLCNSCPITCYNCNISTPDFSQCNTKTCGSDKVCMMKEVKSMTGGLHSYTLACETISVCNGNRKRSMTSRSVYIECCQEDLCNHPTIATTTASTSTVQSQTHTSKPTTAARDKIDTEISTQAIINPTSTYFSTSVALHSSTSESGQWSEWTSWGLCTSARPGDVQHKNRTRCFKATKDNCSEEKTEFDFKWCIDTCTPPVILDIGVMGKWGISDLVLLHCVTKGDPKPTVKWLTDVDNRLEVISGDTSRILIGPIESKHAGFYTCVSFNNCGSANMTYYARPQIPILAG